MLLSQKAILQLGSLEAFANHYYLSYKKDKDLVCLCYNQLKTVKNPTTNECRGIVFDSTTNKVVCYPFNRFGDFDFKKHKLDFDKGIFLEKIDGSICTLYHHKGEWNISTKTTPTGNGMVEMGGNKTFKQYFFECFENPHTLNEDFCYIFEFKFPSDTHHLIPCNNPKITLIGVRNKLTMDELNPFEFGHSFNLPNSKKFDNLKSLNSYINELNPMESEGLVYVNYYNKKDGNFQRFKVKSPQFELLGLLSRKVLQDTEKERERIKFNNKWLKKICSVNTHREFLNYPKFNQFTETVKMIDSTIKELKEQLEAYKDFSDVKKVNFLQVSEDVKSFIFQNIKKGITVDEFIRNKFGN